MKKTCSFEGCTNPSHARGLCRSHYAQQHRGIELRPLRPNKKFVDPAPGLKICTLCERILRAEQDFYLRVGGTRNSWCKECMKARARENRAAVRR